MNEDLWGCRSEWSQNHLKYWNSDGKSYDKSYDKTKPLCSVCEKSISALEILPDQEAPEQPNVLHIKRRIFI